MKVRVDGSNKDGESSYTRAATEALVMAEALVMRVNGVFINDVNALAPTSNRPMSGCAD